MLPQAHRPLPQEKEKKFFFLNLYNSWSLLGSQL